MPPFQLTPAQTKKAQAIDSIIFSLSLACAFFMAPEKPRKAEEAITYFSSLAVRQRCVVAL
jgi:hypothetical protein